MDGAPDIESVLNHGFLQAVIDPVKFSSLGGKFGGRLSFGRLRVRLAFGLKHIVQDFEGGLSVGGRQNFQSAPVSGLHVGSLPFGASAGGAQISGGEVGVLS